MRVYDFIIGKKLTPNYIQTLNIERFDNLDNNGNEVNYNTLINITKLLNEKVTATFNKMNAVPEELNNLLSELSGLQYSIEQGTIDDEKGFSKLRSILAAFSFIGYEIYVISLVNVKDASTFKPATRAYLVNLNDELCPTLNRVAEGMSMTFDIPQDASLPNTIMSFLENEIAIDPIIADVIGLNTMKEKYNALMKLNAGWQFNIKPLEDFFMDYGYKFVICTEA